MTSINGVATSTGAVTQHPNHTPAATGPSDARAFTIPMRPVAASTSPVGAPTPPAAPTAPKLGGHELQEQALKLHEYRLQLIASNIANADTPNYKAVDIDFREALLNAKARPANGHTLTPSVRVAYTTPAQPSVDGNTVDMDQERAKFTDSMLRYQFSLNKVGGHYKMMAELLNNLKD